MPKLAKRSPAGGEHGGYGWRPDLPDMRDFLHAPDPKALRKLATTPHFDLRGQRALPSVWDQGQLGSCTAHAVGACFAFAHRKAGHRAMMPARLWIYFQERVIEGTVNEDAGAEIRDGFKAVATVGVPPERDWTYDISTFAQPPSAKAVSDAVRHKALVYRRVGQTLTSMKAALLAGFPFAYGFTVYDSFESDEVARTGVVPMPSLGESVLDGHAVVAVGYDDPSQRFIVRNSWGREWGDEGYFTMPYAYMLDRSLSADFWTASLAS